MTTTEIKYFHREYKNDVENLVFEDHQILLDLSKRIGLVGLPFLSLYKPAGQVLAEGLGALRTVGTATQLFESIKNGNAQEITYNLLETCICVIALAGSIFAHPLGMIITTSHDLLTELVQIVKHVQNHEHEAILEHCLNIVNNSLYLAVSLGGGIQLKIASLSCQILIGLFHAKDEFQAGNWLEGAGHLAMALIRSNQLALQVEQLYPRKPVAEPTQLSLENKALSTVDSTVPKEEIHKKLVEKGYDPNNVTNAGDNVLHQATKKNDLEAVKLAVAYQIDPMSPNKQGDTPLHLAADKGFLPICTYLVENGSSITQANYQHQTPFHKALKNSHTEVLKLFEFHGYKPSDALTDKLLSWGYLPNSTDKQGNTLVHKAVIDQNEEILHLLVESGYSVDEANLKGMTPFMLATDKGYVSLMKYLHSQGANLNLHNKDGDAALHIACKNKNPPVVKSLLGLSGLDVHTKNDQISPFATGVLRQTPLDYAIAKEDIYAAEYLLEAGVKINIDLEIEKMAFHTAVHSMDIKKNQIMLDLLLKYRSNFINEKKSNTY